MDPVLKILINWRKLAGLLLGFALWLCRCVLKIAGACFLKSASFQSGLLQNAFGRQLPSVKHKGGR